MDSSVFVDVDALPLRHMGDVYRGKVRAVYWLTPEDSRALIQTRSYEIPPDAPLGIMVISDRISAFDCVWKAEGGLNGVPGKGAALNAISLHWFDALQQDGIEHHVVEAPHPMMWVVRRAKPLRFEVILRQYITGSMWRAYARGSRTFCGIALPDGLQRDQRLDQLLLTPSTKGTITGLTGVPETEDAPITVDDIARHWQAFGLRDASDLTHVTALATSSFAHIARKYARCGQILVDTKFEFGWLEQVDGQPRLALIDEIGTPDSSRLWEPAAYADGRIIESCKEGFRQYLLDHLDQQVLTDPEQMPQRMALAQQSLLPAALFESVSETYRGVAEAVCGTPLAIPTQPRAEIIDWLGRFGLLVPGAIA